MAAVVPRRGFFLLLLGVPLAACTGGSSNLRAAAEVPEQASELRFVVSAPPAAAQPARTATPAGPKRRVVVLDPGHGGDDVGASANGVVEKASNLDFAFRIEKLLRAEGIDVVLTRRTDTRAAAQVPGYTAALSDLQARILRANRAGGDLFVSLHGNSGSEAAQKGVEAWFDSKRAFAAEGKRFAGLAVEHVLGELRGVGYVAQDRGLFDGSCYSLREGRCINLFVIGGARAITRQEVQLSGGDPEALGFAGRDVIYSTPTNMPAALLELLIITNPQDAAMLRSDQARDAIARGVASAIRTYFATRPGS